MGRVVWISEEARPFGGCETYIRNTVPLLRVHGWSSSLLYRFQSKVDPAYVDVFDEAYPLVDGDRQLRGLRPDVVYVQRWKGRELVETLARGPWPTLRMYHDATLFCLRGHGMNFFTGQACAHCLGWRCLLDLGFVNRGSGLLPVEFASLRGARAELAANRRLDGFVVASDHTRGVLVRHGFDEGRIHTIPLSVKPPRPVEGVERDGRTVLFVGQLVRGKGVDLLLQAAARLSSELNFVIVGSGNAEGALKRQAHELGLANVRFVARVPQDELARWYASAVCTVMPGRQAETFGLVGPEAFSYETPVVGVDLGAIPEWLRDGENGLLVPPYDPAALAAAIGRLTDDPALTRRLGGQGRHTYETNHRGERYGRLLSELLERTAAGRKEMAA